MTNRHRHRQRPTIALRIRPRGRLAEVLGQSLRATELIAALEYVHGQLPGSQRQRPQGSDARTGTRRQELQPRWPIDNPANGGRPSATTTIHDPREGSLPLLQPILRPRRRDRLDTRREAVRQPLRPDPEGARQPRLRPERSTAASRRGVTAAVQPVPELGRGWDQARRGGGPGHSGLPRRSRRGADRVAPSTRSDADFDARRWSALPSGT